MPYIPHTDDETAAMLAIAATLILAFIGGRPKSPDTVLPTDKARDATVQPPQSRLAFNDTSPADQVSNRRASC